MVEVVEGVEGVEEVAVAGAHTIPSRLNGRTCCRDWL
jgi:hypothetical protein